MRLYHDGSNSYVADNGSGSLILASTFGGVLIRKHNVNETMAGFNPDSSVDLYFNGDKKFETTGAGVTVTGTTFSNQLNVSGVSTFHDTVTATEITAPTGSTLEISGGSSDASANAKITFPQNDSAEFKIEGAYGGSANLRIDSMTSGNVILRTGNSSQNATITLQPNVIDLKGHTEIDTLNVSGLSTFQGNVHLLDDDKLLLGGAAGTHDGLEIYHDGSHSYIDDAGTGNLYLRSGTLSIQNLAGSKTSAVFQSGSSQEFYFNNSKKLETTSAGVSIYNDLNVGTGVTIYGNSGIVSATSFFGAVTGDVTGNADSATQVATEHTDLNAEHYPTFVNSNNNSATNESLKTDGGISYNPGNNTLTTSNIIVNVDLDVDGHTELDDVNVSGISTFASALDINDDVHVSGVVTATEFYGDGSNLSGIVASADPAGSDGQIQYNNGGTTGGAAQLYYDDSNNRLGIGTDVPTTELDVAGGNITIRNGSGALAERNVIRTNAAGQLQFLRNAAINNQVSVTIDDANGDVGIGEDSPDHKLHIQGNIGLRDHAVVGTVNNLTTTSTTQTTVASISASTHRSVEFLVQATEGTNYHVVKVLVIHDGSTAYNTQYGEMFTNTSVFSLDADISGGNIRLLGTSASANSTVYKISFQSIKV